MYKRWLTKSREETLAKAKEEAAKMTGGEVLFLQGELGSGKTTFTQGLAKGFGIKKRIISPTFILMRVYKIDNQNQIKYLYHVDLYRIKYPSEIEDLGLYEIIGKPENIVAIEWPEKLKKDLEGRIYKYKFTYLGENKRKIELESSDE